MTSFRPDHLPIVAAEGITPYRLSSPPLVRANNERIVRREPTYDIVEMHDEQGTRVARHVLEGNASPPQRDRFRAAVQAWVQLQEAEGMRSIVRVDRTDSHGRWFETAPCSVGTLADIVALEWPLDRTLDMIQTLCWGLSTLHAAGVVHGSLSPSNIWLSAELTPLIAGIGLVDVFADLDGDEDGTFGYGPYAAPEARRGEPGIAADIYSVGQILYYALHGQHPSVDGPPLRPLTELSEVPAGLVRIIRRCTAADPSKRYASAFELIADLRKYGRYAEVGLAHPDVEDANRTGLIRAQNEPSSSPPAACPVRRSSPVEEAVSRPPWKRSPVVAGIILGVVFAVSSAWLHPMRGLERYRERGSLAASSAGKRAEAARALVAMGDRALSGLDFSGADFANLDLAGARLDGTSFRGADLSGADLCGASLQGASLEDARIEGADLSGTSLDDVSGVRSATCDEATSFPEGWHCDDGHPERLDARREEGESP